MKRHLYAFLFGITLLFVCSVETSPQTRGGTVLRAGIYRVVGASPTMEVSSPSSTSLTLRQWQTTTPNPPADKSMYFNAGTATLQKDGVTWLSKNVDVAGYCCGNNVELRFRIESSTSFIGFSYRLWPLNGARPGPNEGWVPLNDVWVLVQNLAPPPPDPSSEIKRSDLVDSGARFSSLTGEVEVFHANEKRKDRRFVKLNSVLYVGDHIVTGVDSTAIIGFADLSTFLQKPESEIVITTPPETESKIRLVAGNIWANIKKMWKDGTMEVEMSQAIAGTRGTTFVLEERPGSSTTKVLEGVMEVSSKRTKQRILVNAGYMVTATTAGLGPLVRFSTAAEAALWEPLRTANSTPNQLPLDRLGNEWTVMEYGIQGRWVRRGVSNLWIGTWENGVEAELTITMSDNRIKVSRRDIRGPALCTATYEGKLSPDKTIRGTETYNCGGGNAVQNWEGRIVR